MVDLQVNAVRFIVDAVIKRIAAMGGRPVGPVGEEIVIGREVRAELVHFLVTVPGSASLVLSTAMAAWLRLARDAEQRTACTSPVAQSPTKRLESSLAAPSS